MQSNTKKAEELYVVFTQSTTDEAIIRKNIKQQVKHLEEVRLAHHMTSSKMIEFLNYTLSTTNNSVNCLYIREYFCKPYYYFNSLVDLLNKNPNITTLKISIYHDDFLKSLEKFKNNKSLLKVSFDDGSVVRSISLDCFSNYFEPVVKFFRENTKVLYFTWFSFDKKIVYVKNINSNKKSNI